MVIKTASPGIVVNEVDLTRGTSDAITTNVGAFAGPFEKGPVDELVLIETEVEFQRVFGDPNDQNYEYWWTVSNYLEYGGVCYVVRCDDAVGDSSGVGLQTMKNATDEIVTSPSDTPVYIKNKTDFDENYYLSASAPGKFVARSPGAWANGIAVAVIDHGADYQVGLKTIGIVTAAAGAAVTDGTAFDNTVSSGDAVGSYIRVQAAAGTATLALGDFVEQYDGSGAAGAQTGKGIVMDITSDKYLILVLSGSFPIGATSTLSSDAGTTETAGISVAYPVGDYKFFKEENATKQIISVIWEPNNYTSVQGSDFGWTTKPTANLRVTTGGPAALGDAYIWNAGQQKWLVDFTPAADQLINDGTNVYKISAADSWYDQQIAFAGVPWYRFGSRPDSTANALDRGASNDELNIIIYDAEGTLTGSKGNILESYFGVSKLSGAKTQEGGLNFYVDVINERSSYLFANNPLDLIAGNLNTTLKATGSPMASGAVAGYVDPKSYLMAFGVNNYSVTLGELQDAYNKLETENVPELDYILQGPGLGTLNDSVAKANFIISIAEERKDCMAFLSPPRYAIIGQTDSEAITDKIVEWANEISSSSYAVFDSGYKYTYDRFNDKYRHVPLNGDVCGLLVNASLTSEAWYSPAGLARGQIRNVVKLSYNPSKTQRDNLYTARVNPVVTFPGEGTILFGDKTALGYSSAFDRINVRKLFLVIEKEIAKISRTTLFEFNDDVTRSLFKNNVNPFMRDIQAKRGMYDFLVVCDSTNNVPEVVDRNEFIADIYIKPAKSINFISLNFIATKTGVNFDESVGLFRGS